jgi:hypothetical protein
MQSIHNSSLFIERLKNRGLPCEVVCLDASGWRKCSLMNTCDHHSDSTSHAIRIFENINIDIMSVRIGGERGVYEADSESPI